PHSTKVVCLVEMAHQCPQKSCNVVVLLRDLRHHDGFSVHPLDVRILPIPSQELLIGHPLARHGHDRSSWRRGDLLRHVVSPADGSRAISRAISWQSLSPRPERLTTTTRSFGSFGASFAVGASA